MGLTELELGWNVLFLGPGETSRSILPYKRVGDGMY